MPEDFVDRLRNASSIEELRKIFEAEMASVMASISVLDQQTGLLSTKEIRDAYDVYNAPPSEETIEQFRKAAEEFDLKHGLTKEQSKERFDQLIQEVFPDYNPSG